MKVMAVVGIRPEMIKSAPLLRVLNKRSDVFLQLIHSGQHYDYELSQIFFEQLGISDPICNLCVGSGSHTSQTARLMIKLERIIGRLKPNVVIVFGDANTTLGASLTATKMHIPVCHVEAGLRSYDMRMPEEINRVLVDHCSQVLCAPTVTATANLKKEGIPEERVLLSGDTNYDALLMYQSQIERSKIIQNLAIESKSYVVLTVHRAENTDDHTKLRSIMSAIASLRDVKIVFPLHPRTRKSLENASLMATLRSRTNLLIVDPLGYFDMVNLMKNASVVLTDSGGIQKEAFMVHVPCVTLRDSTEWVETVETGANKLVGTNPRQIVEETRRFLENGESKKMFEYLRNPYGDGKASEKIVEELLSRNLSI